MNLNSRLEEVITLINLLKTVSWGAIPILLSVIVPVFFTAAIKFLPQAPQVLPPQTQEVAPPVAKPTFMQRIRSWFTLPELNKLIVYGSIALFVTGIFTLKIDQGSKERIRNIGLRMKEYYLVKNRYQVHRDSLTKGSALLFGASDYDIQRVLDLYPNEFLEVDRDRTIILRDSVYFRAIINNSVTLLDNYLSGTDCQEFDALFDFDKRFTNEVVNKLIIDSSHKYRYTYWNDSIQHRKFQVVCRQVAENRQAAE